MNAVPMDLLRACPELFSVPDLWLKLDSQPRMLDVGAVLSTLCANWLDPLDPASALRALLERGEFAAAERLLWTALPPGNIDEATEKLFTQSLKDRKSSAARVVNAEAFLLHGRAARLSARPSIDGWIEEAKRLAESSLPEATEALRLAETDLANAEAREAEFLSRLLTRRNEAAEQADSVWTSSVESAIKAKDFPLARWLLDTGPSTPVPSFAPWRRPWPYPTRDDLAVIGWFRNGSEAVPRGFHQSWGIAGNDPEGWRLLLAIDPIVQSKGKGVEPEDATRFFDALEECLGVSRPTQSVRFLCRSSAGVWGRVAGLRPPGFYAFTSEEYDGGVVFALAAESGGGAAGVDRLADSPEPTDDLWMEEESVVPQRDVPSDETYVRIGGRLAGWSATDGIQFSIHDLFRLVGDRNRSLNLVREVGRRLPLSKAMSAPLPPPDGKFVLGREAEQEAMRSASEVSVWVGPPASGRSALLRGAEIESQALGWAVLRLSPLFGPGGVWASLREEMLSVCPSVVPPESPEGLANWLGACEKNGVLITIDDLDRLQPDAASETLLTLASMQRTYRNLRCITTALPLRTWKSPNIAGVRVHGVSPYLRLDQARRVTTTITDFVGVRFETVADCDFLVYAVGGHIGLLHRVIWEALIQLGDRAPREIVIASRDALENAVSSAGVRLEAQRLLEQIRLDPLLCITFAALLLERPSVNVSGWVDLGALACWPELFGLPLSQEEIRDALTELSYCGLAIHRDGDWDLPPGGMTMLLADLVGSAEDYLEQAVLRATAQANLAGEMTDSEE